MRITRLLFILLLINVHEAWAHREQVYFLTGTIGEEEVGLQLDETGDDCMARFFTFNNLHDRIFEGKILGGDWFELFAASWAEEKPADRDLDYLVLREVETDRWEGNFRRADGTQMEVNLVRIEIDSIHHPYLDIVKKFNLTPYAALKTRDVKFEFGETKRWNKNSSIRLVKEPVSGVEWFRIQQTGNETEQLDSINDWLTADHLMYVAQKYGIPLELDTGCYRVDYDVQFLNSHFLSYIVNYQSVSLSGSPLHETIRHTLQIGNARQVMLEDLFWFDENPKPLLTEGEYKWTRYRYKAFGPKIYELLQQLYPRKFSDEHQNECRYNDIRIWYFPEWYLQRKGLTLISKAPLTNHNCKEVPSCIIPYRVLKPYMVDPNAF